MPRSAIEPAALPAKDAAVLASLSWLDRLLPLGILLAMAGGLLLGRLMPGLQLTDGHISPETVMGPPSLR